MLREAFPSDNPSVTPWYALSGAGLWLQIEQHVVMVFVVKSRVVGRIISLAGVHSNLYVPILESLDVFDKQPCNSGSVWGSVQ